MVSHPKKPIKNSELLVGPKIIGFFLILLVVAGVLFILGAGVKKILTPPSIVLESPKNGELSPNPAIEVRGKTDTGSLLTLNGEQLEINKDGKFREIVVLQPGLNTIKLASKKRYSNSRQIQVQVVYEASRNLSLK